VNCLGSLCITGAFLAFYFLSSSSTYPPSCGADASYFPALCFPSCCCFCQIDPNSIVRKFYGNLVCQEYFSKRSVGAWIRYTGRKLMICRFSENWVRLFREHKWRHYAEQWLHCAVPQKGKSCEFYLWAWRVKIPVSDGQTFWFVCLQTTLWEQEIDMSHGCHNWEQQHSCSRRTSFLPTNG
jgi:hypothetical protein